MNDARLVVLVPPGLAAGFLLAGAEVVVPAGEPAAELDRLVEAGVEVVAVYEPYLAGLAAERRRALDASVTPVVIAVPAGIGPPGESGRRARLAARLREAIGYHMTFGGEE